MLTPRHDVFLSHHASDKPAVEELARRLVRAGLVPWLDSASTWVEFRHSLDDESAFHSFEGEEPVVWFSSDDEVSVFVVRYANGHRELRDWRYPTRFIPY